MKKILLITSGQPSLNPRLVKEADALAEAGYAVTVIYQYWNAWGTALDQKFLASKKWQAIRVNGDPVEQKFSYWLSKAIHKTTKKVAKLIGINAITSIFALSRGTYGLIKIAKSIQADLYIAHNLAALPAAVKAASKYKAKCGFDAEDLHRYETKTNNMDFNFRLIKYVEEAYFPKADYLTTSSPLISERYQSIFPKLSFSLILNVFPVQEIDITIPNKDYNILKLFWFSQHIGLSRGLQDVIYALKLLENEKIELHLLGSLSIQVKTELDQIISAINFSKAPQIFFYEPIAPDDLFSFASQFHIGLATEPSFSINNDLALSNKLFSYLQAGLVLVVSDTSAQESFIREHPKTGSSYKKGDPQHLAQVLKTYIDDDTLLKNQQLEASNSAKFNLNWNIEQKKFLAIVEQTLQ
ncbi:hypothetical protein [Pedobacter jeongneungensis]|uniref:hypothetical protein n=1 Tax=Pedobacter jeongneungensis TaxID=947309 RepID=UPI00046A3819|nr:hypothetical protein [Pedobacter jeongneungensis]